MSGLDEPPHESVVPTGLLLASALFGLYALAAAPSVSWLDSGNLVASAWTMGVAHPPGEAVWLVFARLAQLVPIGDIAFRTSLLSAACAAACVLPLLALCREGRASTSPAGLSVAMVVCAGLLGFAVKLQAVRPEVYSATALLLLCALAAASKGGVRGAAALGLLLGLGVGLHPLLCAAAVPALLFALWLGPRAAPREAFGVRTLVAGIGGGLVGLGALAWLPLRAMANPAGAWGRPDTPERFGDVLLARNFARNFGGEASSVLDNLAAVGRVWSAGSFRCCCLQSRCSSWRRTPVSHGSVSGSESPLCG